MEQLLVLARHNGKAVLCQQLAQLWVEVRQLGGVDQVGHVHPQSVGYVEILLQQFFLASLQAFHECLFLVGVLHGTHLVAGTVVIVAPRFAFAFLDAAEIYCLVEHVHQRVVPRRTAINAAQVGILERVALPSSRGISQHAQVGEAESRYVHVVVNLLVQLLHVNLRHGHLHHTLFLAARCHQGKRTYYK